MLWSILTCTSFSPPQNMLDFSRAVILLTSSLFDRKSSVYSFFVKKSFEQEIDFIRSQVESIQTSNPELPMFVAGTKKMPQVCRQLKLSASRVSRWQSKDGWAVLPLWQHLPLSLAPSCMRLPFSAFAFEPGLFFLKLLKFWRAFAACHVVIREVNVFLALVDGKCGFLALRWSM